MHSGVDSDGSGNFAIRAPPDPQETLRERLRELAGSWVGLRLPQTNGHAEARGLERERQAHLLVNAKRIYCLFTEGGSDCADQPWQESATAARGEWSGSVQESEVEQVGPRADGPRVDRRRLGQECSSGSHLSCVSDGIKSPQLGMFIWVPT